MINLDRLLDHTYSKQTLKEMIGQYKVGQKVQLTKDCLTWIKEHAYVMHTVGMKEDNGVITKAVAENDLFIDLSIGNGYPYTAEIIDFIADVGDSTPGARLKITLSSGQEKRMVQSVVDFY